MDYAAIRAVHVACASLSITLFVARGCMQLAGLNWRRWRWLLVAPHLNDTLLLIAAIALALQSHQYPLAQPWLTAKVAALFIYVAAGSVALRAGASGVRQRVAFSTALASVAYIVGVALTRSAMLGLGA